MVQISHSWVVFHPLVAPMLRMATAAEDDEVAYSSPELRKKVTKLVATAPRGFSIVSV